VNTNEPIVDTRIYPRTAAVVMLSFLIGIVAFSESAAAQSPYRVFGTGGIGVGIRLGSPTGTKVGGPGEGATNFTVNCQTTGPSLGGSNIWDQITFGTTTGFVPDAFIWTGYDGFDPRLARCGAAPAPSPSPAPAPSSTPPPFSGSCRSDPKQEYIKGVEVGTQAAGWDIRVYPTRKMRLLKPDLITSLGMSLLGDCGLGTQAQAVWDSLRQQLRCHALWQAQGIFGGPDWGLEAWRPTIPDNKITDPRWVKKHACNWDADGNHAA
jgi:hypothetical protein